MGQLHLQFAFLRAGALGKNIQNQAGAVNDFGGDDFFQIFLLGGRNFVVKNNGVRLEQAGFLGDFFHFSAPDERSRLVRVDAYLKDARHPAACRVREAF